MQQAVRKYLLALEAGDADKAASLFVADGWVQSPFLGRLPVRDYVNKVTRASSGSKLTVHDVLVSAEGHLRAVAYYLYWRSIAPISSTSIRIPAVSSPSCWFTIPVRCATSSKTDTPDPRD
jgi:hypothetical protein